MSRSMAVLWIYQQVKDAHGRVAEAGQKPALCIQGKEYCLCVAAGPPVRVLKRPRVDFIQCRAVIAGDVGVNPSDPYPIEAAITKFEEIATRTGITAGARLLLDLARDASLPWPEDEETINDEEELTEMRSETPADKAPEDTETKSATSAEEKPVKAKTKRAAKKAARTTNGSGKKADKGPSKISQAVAWMREQIKKEGGAKELERGYLKGELFPAAAKKFGLAESTCQIQYNRQIINKGSSAGK